MQEMLNAITGQKLRPSGVSAPAFSPLDLMSGPNDAWFAFGDFASTYQESGEIAAVTGDGQPVGSVQSQYGGGVLKAQQAIAGSRPTARVLDGQASIFQNSDPLILPAGLTLNWRDCTIFMVSRSRESGRIMSHWHMPQAGASDLALYLQSTVDGANTLRQWIGGTATDSGIDSSHGMTCAVLVCRAGESRIYYGTEVATFNAPAAGSSAGGIIGGWNAGALEYLGHSYDAGCFGRALSEAEIFQLMDYFTTSRGALSRNATSVIVALGDSTRLGTIAAGSANVHDDSSLSQLARLCASEPKYVNLGEGGLRAELAITANSVAQINKNAAYADRVFLLGPLGTNDIYSHGRTGVQVIADLTRLVGEVNAGVTGPPPIVIGATVLPRNGTPGQLAARAEVNDWMRGSTLFDHLIDFDGDVRLANPANASVYGDGIHPTHLGYGYMAETERAVLQPLGLVS